VIDCEANVCFIDDDVRALMAKMVLLAHLA